MSSGRTVADLIAEALLRRALEGDVEAVKETTNRVEGKVAPACHDEHPEQPVKIGFVPAIPRPPRQEQLVPVSTLAS